MIITVTPNPSIDRTAVLDTPLVRGAVHRIASIGTQAAGKGVNISRAAVAAGVDTVAVLPAGDDDPYTRELRDTGLAVRPVPPAGAVRINLSITEPDGTTTKLNSPGDTVEAADLDRLTEAIVAEAASRSAGDWVVFAGSVPPGTPSHWYADLVALLAATPVRVAVDTSDASLAALIERLSTAAPHLIKPNSDELASLTGGDPEALEADPAAAATAAAGLVADGIEAVLVTLGGKGAVLVTAEGAWRATPPPIEVVSTVGAGDSSLFGYLLGHERGLPPAERLALAVAYGSAAASLPGTTVPTPDQVRPDLVGVEELSRT